MRVTPIDITPLLMSSLDHVECRELVEAAVGYRISRLYLREDRIDIARRWAQEYGLFVDFSDFTIEEVDTVEGKGQWANLGKRSSRPDGVRFLYVGRDRKLVSKAKNAEAREDAHEFGALLRIPECCIEFYELHRDEALRDYADDFAPITTRMTSVRPPYDWRTNYLAQYYGHSLIHHYPCTWNCAASLRRAQDSLDIVRSVSSLWASRFEQELRGVVIFENQRGVHMIKKTPSTKTFRYRRDQVISTCPTPLSSSLRSNEYLEFDSKYRVILPEAISQACDGGTLILPFT